MIILSILNLYSAEPIQSTHGINAFPHISYNLDQDHTYLTLYIAKGDENHTQVLALMNTHQTIKNVDIDFAKDCLGDEISIVQQLADSEKLEGLESFRIKCPRSIFKKLYKSTIRMHITHLYCAYGANKQLSMSKRHKKLALFPHLHELKLFDISQNPALPKTLHNILSMITDNCATNNMGSIRICNEQPTPHISIWKSFEPDEDRAASNRSTRQPDCTLKNGETALFVNANCLVKKYEELLKSIIKRYPGITHITVQGLCQKEGIDILNSIASHDCITSVYIKCQDQTALEALQACEKLVGKLATTH